MQNVACSFILLILLGTTSSADPPERGLRPISDADAVVAMYYQDWGLSSSGSPRIILAAWPDGSIIWSDDRVKGGAPYRVGHVDPKKFVALLARFEKDGLFSDKKFNQGHYGPDSQFITVLAKSGKKKITMQSWHEVYEESGSLVDDHGVSGLNGRRRVDALRVLPPDYMFFRLLWSETRGKMADLIPPESTVSSGRPHMTAGVLSWQETVPPP